jgi:hypothetical protein
MMVFNTILYRIIKGLNFYPITFIPPSGNIIPYNDPNPICAHINSETNTNKKIIIKNAKGVKLVAASIVGKGIQLLNRISRKKLKSFISGIRLCAVFGQSFPSLLSFLSFQCLFPIFHSLPMCF